MLSTFLLHKTVIFLSCCYGKRRDTSSEMGNAAQWWDAYYAASIPSTSILARKMSQ